MSKFPDTVQVTTRIPADLAAQLADLARSERRSMGNMLTRIIELYLLDQKSIPVLTQCDEA